MGSNHSNLVSTENGTLTRDHDAGVYNWTSSRFPTSIIVDVKISFATLESIPDDQVIYSTLHDKIPLYKHFNADFHPCIKLLTNPKLKILPIHTNTVKVYSINSGLLSFTLYQASDTLGRKNSLQRCMKI